MPVAVGSTPVTAIYHGSTLIADLRHASQQITVGSGATVPDAPTGVSVSVANLTVPDAPTGVAVSVTDETDEYYDLVVLSLNEELRDDSPWYQQLSFGSGWATTTQSKVGTNAISIAGNGLACRTVMPNDASLELVGDFTLEGWFYPSGVDQYGPFMYRQTSSSASGDYTVFRMGAGFNSGVAQFGTRWGGTDFSLDGVADLRNAWHHVAVTREGSTVRLFVDGSVVNSGTWSNPVVWDDGHIGDVDGATYQNNTDNEWQGRFDSLRLTNGHCRYNASFTPTTEPYPLYGPVDEHWSKTLVTLRAFNTSGNTSNAFTTAVVLVGTTGYTNAEYKFGGRSIFCPAGSANYIQVNSANTIGTEDFTLEGWFRFPNAVVATADIGVLFDFKPSGGSYIGPYPNLYLRTATGGSLAYFVAGDTRIETPYALATNTWYHVVLCRDSGTTSMYVDGVSIGTWADSTNYGTVSNFRLGRNESGSAGGAMYVSDARATVGVARYPTASTISVPTRTLPVHNGDPYYRWNTLLLQDAATDNSPRKWSITTNGNAAFTTTNPKVGTHSLELSSGDSLFISDSVFGAWGSSVPFTVEAWVYWDGTVTGTPYMAILGGHTGLSTNLYGWYIHNSKFSLFVSSATFQNNNTSGDFAVTANQWFHVAHSRDGSGVHRLYKDGVLVRTFTSTQSLSANSGFYIGTDPASNRPTFPGFLDDIRITYNICRYKNDNIILPITAHPN